MGDTNTGMLRILLHLFLVIIIIYIHIMPSKGMSTSAKYLWPEKFEEKQSLVQKKITVNPINPQSRKQRNFTMSLDPIDRNLGLKLHFPANFIHQVKTSDKNVTKHLPI